MKVTIRFVIIAVVAIQFDVLLQFNPCLLLYRCSFVVLSSIP